MRLTRGYPRVRAELDRQAQQVRFDPMLWCDGCAPPLVVQWWIRWERMAGELLQTLPSIPADVEVAGEAAADEAESFTGEADEVACIDVGTEADAYDRVVLP